jgi:hypothetical protein
MARPIPRPANVGAGLSGPFYGVYRGVVVGGADPMQMMRLQAQVPAVGGLATAWAMPCAAYDCRVVPPIGADVWIMFEGGDPAYPVWIGSVPG